MNLLAQTRKNIGMSQEKLAKEVKISRQYLSEIENEKNNQVLLLQSKLLKC